MRLSDVVSACQVKGVTISLNLGEHSNCDLESNCPKAIQLRTFIQEAKVTPAILLEGFAEYTRVGLPGRPLNPPNFNIDTIMGQINGRADRQEGKGQKPLADVSDKTHQSQDQKITHQMMDFF